VIPARAISRKQNLLMANRSSGERRSAAAYIASRQDQKSPAAPARRSVRPRMARWKAWLWALTRPGRIAQPGKLTRSASAGGPPTDCTRPSLTTSAAPERTWPPL
jgi:hypothetical protein